MKPFVLLPLLMLTLFSQGSPGVPAASLAWDHWYTVTLDGNIHYEIYNDKLETKENKLHFTEHAWKKEEDFINEEQVGGFAENNASLSPLFFNFHSTYRATETVIDGNVQNGNFLSVKIRKGGQELPLVKKGIPSKAFFSNFFPVWLGKQLSSLRPGQRREFSTIVEDDIDHGFQTVGGAVTLERSDDFASKTHVHKVRVDFQGRSIWWIDSSGSAVRIVFLVNDQPRTVVERTTHDAALKFLPIGK